MRCNDANVVDIKGKQSLSPQPLSEERGEWLAMEMEEVILGLFRDGDVVDNEA